MTKSLSKTPAPPKDRIYGSKVNPKGSASSEKSASSIKFDAKTIASLTTKLKEFKETHNTKKVSLSDLKAVYRRGLGAYSSSHRPTISGGKPNSRNAWAMARVNAFLRKAGGGESKKAYVQDDDLLKMHLGGDMSKHLAPNGKPSNLTHEQWHLVRTPEFKAWFGDWEKDPESASKIVDENGEPMVVYHGTNASFNKFKKQNTYFTNSKKYIKKLLGNDFNIKEVFLNNNKVCDLTNLGTREISFATFLKECLKQGAKKDYASLEELEDYVGKDKYMAWQYFRSDETHLSDMAIDWLGYFFDIIIYENSGLYGAKSKTLLFISNKKTKLPNQIKLADGTNTTFDGSNADVRYANGGDVGQNIKCRRCGWEWNTKDSEEFDKYVCHKCGFDNRTYYDKDVLAYNGGGVVKSFYEWYVDWYKRIKNEITILISLPNELQPFKENNVVVINKFKKETDDIKAYNYLQQMVNKADEFGITIYLEPTPIGNVKTKSELIDYYKKFGFELTPNKEFMKRLPRYKDGGEIASDIIEKLKSLGFEKNIQNRYGKVMDEQNYVTAFYDKKLGVYSIRGIHKYKSILGENSIGIKQDFNNENDFFKKIYEYMNKSYKDGGEVDDKKKTYAKWKSLVNMSKGELERFYNSEDGKKAGLSSSEAKSQGISSGRESARWIMKMKDTRVADWTPQMWKWANKQISFISRMSGNKGGLYDDKGNKTRKHTSLLIWGNNPEKKSSMQYEYGGHTNKYEISDYWETESFGGGGEVKTKSIITDKIGWNEEVADYFIEQNPKLAIWFADAIMKREIRRSYYGSYFDADGTFGGGYVKIDNDKIARKGVKEFFKTKSIISSNYGGSIRRILDWLQHPLTEKQNLRELSFDEAIEKEKQFHEELKVIGGDMDFVEPEENEIFITYPKDKDGAEFYWVKIPSNFCSLESSRMGHCGRTGSGNTLISLRSIRPYGKGHTINDSHVTIAYNEEDGIFYQTKGKKNQKPAEKYYPYIFDLIKTLAQEDKETRIDEYDYQIEVIFKERQKTEALLDEVSEQIGELRLLIIKYDKILDKTRSQREYEEITKEADDLLSKRNELGSELKRLKNIIYDLDLDINQLESKKDDLQEMYRYGFGGFGAEYGSEEDYGFGDMTDEQVKELYEINPSLFSKLGGRLTLYNRGIVKEKPDLTFILDKDAEYISELFKYKGRAEFLYNVISNNLLEDFEYSVDRDDVVKYYLDDLNEKNKSYIFAEISNITNIPIEEVVENGIEYYLSGDYLDDSDEEYDFDSIIDAIRRAVTYAMDYDANKYYYGEIKNALSELGEVLQLDDDKVKVKIDLSNFLTMNQIESYSQELGYSIDGIFFEAEYRNDIELPRLSFDDRFSPNADSKLINEYFEPEFYEDGGTLPDIRMEDTIARIDDPRLADISYYKKGGTIYQQINSNIMDEIKFNQLPHIDTIIKGDKVIIKESVFTGNIDNPKHMGERYIHCEILGDGGMLNSLNLKVINSVGVNAMLKGQKITRPINNLLTKGRKVLSNATTSFKDGGLNPDNKNVKEYFAHDMGNAGGVLVGKRHSEGGIKAINKGTGQPLEMEGGEVVITRGAVSNSKKYKFNGSEMTTREILSKLNVDGGGVSFAEGGDVPDKMTCGCDKMDFGGTTMSVQDFVQRSDSEYQEERLRMGIEKERKDHYDTLSKLNAGTITIQQALNEIAKKEMKLDSNYPFGE